MAATVEGVRLPQLPRALLWDHNAHHHAWLMRRLPAGRERALDVGCGAGALARRLAARVSAVVDAVDRSEVMIGRARAAAGASNLRWLLGDVLDAFVPLDADGYDVVTAVTAGSPVRTVWVLVPGRRGAAASARRRRSGAPLREPVDATARGVDRQT